MIGWRLARFEELSPREIHDLYRLRAAVFVVEQECAFQDLDGADPECWHLLGYASSLRAGHAAQGELLAYCRLAPPGVKYAEPSIGRVVTLRSARRTGRGRELMGEALASVERLWPGRAVRIGAQQRLERFYQEFGFATASAPYDEDGIAHVEMVRPAARAAKPHEATLGR